MGARMLTDQVFDPKCTHCATCGVACLMGTTERCLPCFRGHSKCEFSKSALTSLLFFYTDSCFTAAKCKALALVAAGHVVSHCAETALVVVFDLI
jgi:hypothetical protein